MSEMEGRHKPRYLVSCCDLAEFRWTEPGVLPGSGPPQWAISLPAYKVFGYLCLQSKQVHKITSNCFEVFFSPECLKHLTDAKFVFLL